MVPKAEKSRGTGSVPLSDAQNESQCSSAGREAGGREDAFLTPALWDHSPLTHVCAQLIKMSGFLRKRWLV